MMTRLILIVLSSLVLMACSTTQSTESAAPANGTAPEPGVAYEAQIERFSAGDAEYSGFYNNFEYKATILNSRIRDVSLSRQGEYYQWDREKQQSEREKSEKEKAAQTDVFLSFFTPDRKNDNLTDSKSIWRVYLDVNGKRYQGKVKKVRSLMAELQVLYPYHTRWNTPYLVSFPVSTSTAEAQSSAVTITGPLGTRSVNFRSVQ